MTAPISVLPLGGCLLHGPLNPMARVGEGLTYPPYGPIPGTYTFGEMRQAIAVLRGEMDVPQQIRPLCSMRPNFTAVDSAADFHDVDVALLEPAIPIEITFRGYTLNRTSVFQQVVAPIRVLGRDANKWAAQWLRVGLLSLNEKARAEAAEELLDFIPANMPHPDFVKEVILEARASRQEALSGFEQMRAIIGRPIGVVVYIFQYLADGRAVSWPAGYHEEVAEAARVLDLPMFEPSEMVRKYGVQAALGPDLRHYNDTFRPIIADALLAFACAVRDKPMRASVVVSKFAPLPISRS
jgi:hypothetical protein